MPGGCFSRAGYAPDEGPVGRISKTRQCVCDKCVCPEWSFGVPPGGHQIGFAEGQIRPMPVWLMSYVGIAHRVEVCPHCGADEFLRSRHSNAFERTLLRLV